MFKMVLVKIETLALISFFFYLGFRSRTLMIHRITGEGGGYSFLVFSTTFTCFTETDIKRVITAESSPLHIASSRTQIENLWFLSVSC